MVWIFKTKSQPIFSFTHSPNDYSIPTDTRARRATQSQQTVSEKLTAFTSIMKNNAELGVYAATDNITNGTSRVNLTHTTLQGVISY